MRSCSLVQCIRRCTSCVHSELVCDHCRRIPSLLYSLLVCESSQVVDVRLVPRVTLVTGCGRMTVYYWWWHVKVTGQRANVDRWVEMVMTSECMSYRTTWQDTVTAHCILSLDARTIIVSEHWNMTRRIQDTVTTMTWRTRYSDNNDKMK